MKYFRKDWILFQELANEDGDYPQDLKLVEAKDGNPDENRHVPFIEETPNGYRVKTGKTGYHATDRDHHTLFVELIVDDQTQQRRYFKFGESPDFEFKTAKGKKVEAYAFCNLHGLWKYTLAQQ